MNFAKISNQLLTLTTLFSTKLLLVIITLIVGLWSISHIAKFLSKYSDYNVQPLLFSEHLMVLLLMIVASTPGLEIISFVTIIGVAVLAVGLTFKRSLSNFMGGLLILIFKPFRVGDLISVQDFTGYVKAIKILNTIVVTTDDKTIVLPNGLLSTSGVLVHNPIRVDLTFVVGSDNDPTATRVSVRKVIDACPYAITEMTHDILINHLNDKETAYDVRVWTQPETYWDTYYYLQKNVAIQFRADGISG